MRLLFLAVLLFLFGCSQEKKANNLDGKKLLEQKCSSCHNLDLSPKTFENETAPPMMAVAFHIKGFIKTEDESQRISKA